jgi:hypothetical protein
MMLELARKLPQGVLLGGEAAALEAALAPTGGLRFVAGADDLLREGTRITGWRATDGQRIAPTSEPNTGNSAWEPGTPPGLQFRDGVNCGFMLPAFAARADQFTAAAIYSSGGEARTLVSVTTGQSMNQVFINETRGAWLAMDRSGTVTLTRPRRPGPGTHLAILSYSGQALALRAGGQTVTAAVKLPQMDAPGDFFIGCRSNRQGLAKTQGTMVLHEVLFWPDRALLVSARAEDAAVLAALDRYVRWTF